MVIALGFRSLLVEGLKSTDAGNDQWPEAGHLSS